MFETMKGSEIVVRALEEQDVKHLFGIPGNHILSVYDALGKSKIKTILCTHEPSVGFMADTYGRITRTPGVALVTAGPGALNIVNPVAQAYIESSPMVVIAAQCNRNNWGKGCYHELEHPNVQYNIFKEITKWQTRITSVNEICEKISEAFYQATSNRPRPVYIEIPEDIFQEEGEFIRCKKKSHLRKGIESELVEKALKMLLEAKQPVIYAGGGVICSDASKELIELSKKLRIPIVTSMMGKSSVPDDYELSFGLGTGKVGNLAAKEILKNADLMFAIGTRFDEVATGFFTLKPPKKLIHLDIDNNEINKNYKASLALVGDAKKVLSQLIEKIPEKKINRDEKSLEKLKKIKNEEKLEIKKEIISTKESIHPLEILYKLDEFLDKDAIIIADAGNSSLWVCEYPVASHRIIAPYGYNSMGFATPSIIAAKLASPNKQVIGFCGDGSFLMTGMEFLTAIKYSLDITLIVLHENRYNILTFFQDMKYNGRYVDTILKTFDFAKFANDSGGLGIKVESKEKLEDAIKQALKHKGPSLLDVYIDPKKIPPVLKRLRS